MVIDDNDSVFRGAKNNSNQLDYDQETKRWKIASANIPYEQNKDGISVFLESILTINNFGAEDVALEGGREIVFKARVEEIRRDCFNIIYSVVPAHECRIGIAHCDLCESRISEKEWRNRRNKLISHLIHVYGNITVEPNS